jgi:peptidoglycan-associated lipoprotein
MRFQTGVKLLAVLIGVAGVAFSAGCSQKAAPGLGLSSEGPIEPGSSREFAVKVGDTIHFESDSVQLTSESQQILAAQAQWLKSYPQYTVTIEGHADERGTREYNIGLGAQRAGAAMKYLVQQGVPARRLRTISYGKERPVATCDDISCWSQNRRAVTALNNRSGMPVATN